MCRSKLYKDAVPWRNLGIRFQMWRDRNKTSQHRQFNDTKNKPTISSCIFVQISPDDLVPKHVGCFVHAIHQFFEDRTRCRSRTIRFHLCPQLYTGFFHCVIVSPKKLDSGSVQTTKTGHCDGSESFESNQNRVIVEHGF